MAAGQSTIGQAHLLDSIIDNLEQEIESPPHPSGKSYYARRTLTYGLGEQVRLAIFFASNPLILESPARLVPEAVGSRLCHKRLQPEAQVVC